MKCNLLALAAIAAGSLISVAPAMAGFVMTTGNNPATINSSTFDVSIPGGTFTNYAPDTLNDPQITTDLSSYGYSITATATSVGSGYTPIDYSGTYQLTYDLGGPYSTIISSGDVTMVATSSGGDYLVTGTLTQTQGPMGTYASSFTDLGKAYDNHPVDLSATYTPSGNEFVGTFQGTMTETATVVPLPASAWSGLALLGGLGLFGAVKRHRKQMA